MLVACHIAILSLQAQSPAVTEYLNLARATLRQPITHEELGAAAVSDEGVAAIRELFERSIDAGMALDDSFVTPELGGEAMLHDRRIEFVTYPDPVHPVVRQMVELEKDPPGLLAALSSGSEGRFVLESTGGLHALLYQLAHEPPSPERLTILHEIVRSAVATQFRTWTTDPLVQADMIEQTTWRGRYAGFWHLHPPRLVGGGFGDGIEPSMADMRNAVDLGQFLTIVFQPDGFDFHDLSALAAIGRPDLSKVRTISYRHATWRPHFEARLRIAQGSRTP